MLQISVEHHFESVNWDNWLLPKVIVLQVEYQLRLVVTVVVHFFQPRLHALVDVFEFSQTPLLRGSREW